MLCAINFPNFKNSHKNLHLSKQKERDETEEVQIFSMYKILQNIFHLNKRAGFQK